MKTSSTPWKLLEPDQVRGSEGQFVADCHCGFMREADRANALLIAAAPELLEACKGILELAKYADGAFNPDIIKICNTAIAKAEGNA